MSDNQAINSSGTPQKVALEMVKYLREIGIERPNTTEEFLALYIKCLNATSGLRV